MRVGAISKYAFVFVVQNQSSSVVLLPPGKVTAVEINVENEVDHLPPWSSQNPQMPYHTGRKKMTAKVSGRGISDFVVTQDFGGMVRGVKPWTIVADHGEIFDTRGTGRTDRGFDVAFRIWVPNVDLMDLLFGQELPDLFAQPLAPPSGTLFVSAPSNALPSSGMRALE